MPYSSLLNFSALNDPNESIWYEHYDEYMHKLINATLWRGY
jgi:hypothetical protein